MGEKVRVLIAENEPLDAELLVRELRRAGFEPEWRRVETEADYRAALAPDLDIILSDYSMPEFDGARALRLLRESRLDVPFILVSGMVGEDAAVAAMKEGANDYLLKDRLTRLGSAVRQAIGQRRERARRTRVEAQLRENVLLLVAQAPVCIAMFDREMRYLALSQRWSLEYGRGYLDLVGRSHYEVFPDLPEAWKEAHRLGLAGEVVKNDEDRWLGPDGNPRWLRWAVHPWRDAQGEIGGIIVSTEDITPRKQAEMALWAGEERMRFALETVGVGAWDLDLVDHSAHRTLGHDRIFGYETLLPRWTYEMFLEHVLPDDRAEVARSFQEATRTYGDWTFECRIRRVDGVVRWIWAAGRHSWNQEDQATRMAGIVQDITDRRQAAAAIQESEARLRLALDAAGMGNWELDLATGTAIWSANHFALFGLAPETRPSFEVWRELVHPDDLARVIEAMESGRRDRSTVALEHRIRRADDGRVAWLSVAGRFVYDDHGVAARFLGVVFDVTRRRQGERQQAMQHAVTRVLADSGSLAAAAAGIIQAVCESLGGEFGALWEIDGQAGELRCADLWRLPELSAGELEAQTREITFGPEVGLPGRVWVSGRPLVLPDLVADGNFPRAASATKAGLRAAFGFPVLVRGEVVGVMDFLGRDRLDPDQELLEALGAIGSQIGQFIEHRSADRQLLQAQKMEAVGQLAGGIAHDFNNLLGVILGYAQIAVRELGPEHRTNRRLEAVCKAAERAAALTRQILTFSRQQVVEARVCDLNRIVEDMEKMLRRLIGEDVRMAVALGEDLGRVRADPGQLEQVIMNLAVNARDAMPAGGRLVIETSNVELDQVYAQSHPDVRPGPHVMLAVSDTGEGMTPATLARIFEPFFTTKEAGKGTGLGLAVVFGIVKQSGGSLSVYSERGHGSTFKIHLPRVFDREVALAEPRREAARGGGETVLVVEDEDALRGIVVETLQEAGYTVLDTADPRAAASLAAKNPQPIHLLITDVVLPGQSGPETATQLRNARPGMRVLLMSGYTDRLLNGQPSAAVATPFLSKPFTIDGLLRKVREVLDLEAPR